MLGAVLFVCLPFVSTAAMFVPDMVGKNCTIKPGFEFGNKTVVEENNIASALACASACQSNPECCVGEFEPPKHHEWKPHCFLMSNASLTPDPTSPKSAIICTPMCGAAPAPRPKPAPSPKPKPSPAPSHKPSPAPSPHTGRTLYGPVNAWW